MSQMNDLEKLFLFIEKFNNKKIWKYLDIKWQINMLKSNENLFKGKIKIWEE